MMYPPMFLYLLFGMFVSFFIFSIYTRNNVTGFFAGIFNIFIALAVIELDFGSRYVTTEEVIGNETVYTYGYELIEIPEVLVVLVFGVIALQLLTNISSDINFYKDFRNK